jgi:catalase-peroxidase
VPQPGRDRFDVPGRDPPTNDFFLNPLHMGTVWKASASAQNVFDSRDCAADEVEWTGTTVDSDSQLRAIAEVYASDDAQAKVRPGLRRAWDKVMNLDRFDLA